jgi:hypothetical protein
MQLGAVGATPVPDAGAVVAVARAVFPWLQSSHLGEIQVVDWGADPYALGALSYPGVGA